MHFDWATLALQTVNILVLIWLLRRFLFQPVAAIVAARQAAAEKLLADAAQARDAATAEADKAAAQRKALAADADAMHAAARQSAEAERAVLLGQARAEVERLTAAENARLAEERVRMQSALEYDAGRLAVRIAAQVLARVPPHQPTRALIQALDAWLATLPDDQRHGLAGDGETLDVVTAVPLSAEEQADCSAMLTRHLGARVTYRFVVDPALIAGVDLRGPHVRVANDLRADLDRISGALIAGRDGR